MTISVEACLTYLRDPAHTLEEAIRGNHLPTGGRARISRLKHRLFGGDDTSLQANVLAARINTFALNVVKRGVESLQGEDFTVLKRIHDHPSLPQKQKDQLFQICLRMGLTNTSPELKEARAKEMASRAIPLARPWILKAIEWIYAFHEPLSEEVISALVSLFHGVDREANAIEFIYWAIFGLPYGQRGPIISLASPLMTGIKHGYTRGGILREVGMLPESHRIALASTFPWMVGIADQFERSDLFETILKLPEAQLKELISLALPLMEGITDANQRAVLFQAIIKLPKAERAAIITLAKPLMQGVTNGKERAAILLAIKNLPESEQVTVIALAQPLMENITDGKAAILQTVGNLPKIHRGNIIRSALPHMQGITHGNQRAAILHAVGNFPRAFSSAESKILRAFVQAMDYASIHLIMPKLIFFPPADRISIMSSLLAMFQARRARIVGSLGEWSFLGLPDRFLETQMARFVSYITPSNILSVLFLKDASLKTTCHAYLQTELSTNADPAFLRPLCQQIITSRNELMLGEEHPLFQATINALILSDPAAITNPKNPYGLYQKLRAQDAAPVALHPPSYETHGKAFHVSMQPLLEEAERVRRATTFGQLPHGVTANTLNDLFQSLDQRMARLSRTAKEQVLSQIESQSGVVYSSLRTEMLEDSYIRRLLHTTGPADERVPLDVMQLFTILQFVLSQPDTLERGQVLTRREDVLIKVAASIRSCPGGKREGIFTAYNWIKGEAGTAPSSTEETARTYLYPIIYRVLTPLLSDDAPLIRDLAGFPPKRNDPQIMDMEVRQLAHQAIYVKNLIGKRVGLVWDLAFDQHTGLLYDALVAKRPEQALQGFFRYFSPSVLLQAVETQVNRDLAATNPTDSTISEKANTLYNLLFDQLDQDPSYWEVELDEDGLPAIESTKAPALKREGVIKLLTGFGYLQESDSRTVVAQEERPEATRQAQIEHILHSMRSSPSIEPLIIQLEQIDRNTANRLFGHMYAALQRTGKLSGYDYFGGGEAAFKRNGEFSEERTAAIDVLVLELRAE